ncbi:MAG: hypothetical protein A3F47_01435 [Candidatus Staskawiczbacteria bacterium RIFCSPHIGHO2_12_FULL_38_11]|uniref:Response regulatory domain-containing protein n=1 Tax=Candidatus Staskawiczbacteria bacterium RIFCSPHIGHO2_12_FULL_38_11 TaxID=1802209 RepID=A0A1G2I6Y3_9BACT|nr:MAG: hypothetical protein A3F47_01435 [Candidatus Staskawiczbacteria bacterium RIFCSPHIGHO2_12_FULL_38_11]
MDLFYNKSNNMTEKNKKVLLVEDDSAIIDIYRMMIEKAGFDVEVITLGQEVIGRIRDQKDKEPLKPDIVLLDLILPDINGMEVLKTIRTDESTKDIRVFILTNQEESQLTQMGSIKPDKFIIKANITPTQLVELIKKELK